MARNAKGGPPREPEILDLLGELLKLVHGAQMPWLDAQRRKSLHDRIGKILGAQGNMNALRNALGVQGEGGDRGRRSSQRTTSRHKEMAMVYAEERARGTRNAAEVVAELLGTSTRSVERAFREWGHLATPNRLAARALNRAMDSDFMTMPIADFREKYQIPSPINEPGREDYFNPDLLRVPKKSQRPPDSN